ncbi:plasmid mobilization protein [Komagataeibacter sucrofermentans]|uniref:Bacterial mobilisation domain-containing protein n=3 Tax=Komagataeibacter TaxID=1434011 RepID=A0ABX5P9E6_9PROT|nr:hypothetical protein CDI09_11430 [Komagataeibacter nataicola]PYD80011.1 hypothetical protein CFR77_05745 [Komagataeibacter sucrofermentans]GBQ52321.1 hypothetical protein AA15973_2740 [Komagataeibacter sucrofermentans DSM 15973]GBR19679.1 hypothetical protein AA0616_1601 [Komagataeibacter nataicola NRIC 0616]
MIRESTLHIRMTDNEKAKAQSYAKSIKKSLSVLVREHITQAIVTNTKGDEIRTELQAIRRELSAQGNNLNQIAKRVNGGEQIGNINDELKEITRLRKQLAKLTASMRGRLS